MSRRRGIAIGLGVLLLAASPAAAQPTLGPPTPGSSPATPALPEALGPGLGSGADSSINPASVLSTAGNLVRGLSEAPASSDDRPGLSAGLNVMLLLTVLSLAPSILLMTTCFVRIIIVLGLVRQALGTQTLPPPQVMLGLSLFMTALVMAPTAERINAEAIAPYGRGEIRTHEEMWLRARQPIRDFMFAQIEATDNWSGLYTILEYRGVDTSSPETLTRADVDMVTLVPAYILSELKTAFLMGFRVYLPFLVIDMVISALLISMGMMMLPPVLISLPFKLLLFVLVDGWALIVGSLMTSFAQPAPEIAMGLGHGVIAISPGIQPIAGVLAAIRTIA